MELEDVRVGTQVRVQLDYREAYREAAHRQGQVGTVKKRYGTRYYRAFEVSFSDGQSDLFWDHQLEDTKQLEEIREPSSRPTWWRWLFR
jgi:hypothetical protein